ncbi:hypothetical protein [Methylobacterium sp. WL120]|uniref:hypothetical protein n=1 Tax=Methylobacterium sp. WL120 TaxID=2603887 RepID=UPI0011CA3AF3|nr:hypothetical protein [Methylobacterium sp. WL120]TXM69097.1 hypothetical protein FV229_06195 [Methylobacterium sp. WL120]
MIEATLQNLGVPDSSHWPIEPSIGDRLTNEPNTQRSLAVVIASNSSPTERTALTAWAEGLLAIRAEDIPAIQKAKRALALTLSSKTVWPVVKVIGRQTKRLAWDDRSTSARLGLGGALTGAVLFGGQSAGIAALGTAVGVPLWVVLGAGATFMNVLREELLRRRD